MNLHTYLYDLTRPPAQYTTPEGLGEPLNIIISARSDPFVLSPDGLTAYARSLGFDEECLGLHIGVLHTADLGDGAGRTPEALLARQSYFPRWGTCWESAVGGNHFRAWRQNGTAANSGAWFLGASKEKDGSKRHTIIPDGYNVGRDLLVEKAAAGSNWRGMWWQADVEWKTGLLKPGSEGRSPRRSPAAYLDNMCRREPRHQAGRPGCHPHHPPALKQKHTTAS
jgi:hypothetical protein